MKKGNRVILGVLSLLISGVWNLRLANADTPISVVEGDEIAKICDKLLTKFPFNPAGPKCKDYRAQCERIISQGIGNDIQTNPGCDLSSESDQKCLAIHETDGNVIQCISVNSCEPEALQEIINRVSNNFGEVLAGECPPLNPGTPPEVPPTKPPVDTPPAENPPQQNPPANPENPTLDSPKVVDGETNKTATATALQLQGGGCSLGTAFAGTDLAWAGLFLPILAWVGKRKKN